MIPIMTLDQNAKKEDKNKIDKQSRQKTKIIKFPAVLSYSSRTGYTSEFPRLHNLWRIMIKLFINPKFASGDFCLNSVEKRILVSIIKKKKFTKEREINLNVEFFSKLREANLRKKTEDSLKFVFNKTFNFLKNQFQLQVLGDEQPSKKEIDSRFYNWYFLKVSQSCEIPIESFYHFQSSKNNACPHIPRSISKGYFERVKMSPAFVFDFRSFLKEHFIKTVVSFNLRKIKGIISRWEKKFETISEETAVK